MATSTPELPDKPKGSKRREKRAGGGPVLLKPMTLDAYTKWQVRIDPSKIYSAEVLQQQIWVLRTPFTNHCFEFPLNCATCLVEPPQTCRIILDQLEDLNEWFWLLATEIREVEPGVLAFTDLDEDEAYGDDPRFSCPLPRAVKQAKKQAAVLLHCLLTRHRCLKVLAGLRHVLPHEYRLLCSGIRHSTVLTSLQLKGCELQGHEIQALVTAIRRMDRLEEFFWNDCTLRGDLRSAQGAFAAYIASTTSLRAFRMSSVQLFTNPRTLVRALEKNESIRSLHLDSSLMSVKVRDIFLKYLSENKTVFELTLVRDVHQWTPNVDKVFLALMVNSTLEKLSLEHFEVDAMIMLKFARVVNWPSNRLREASFLFCDWDVQQLSSKQNQAQHWEIHRLVSQIVPAGRTPPFVWDLGGPSHIRRLTLHANRKDAESPQLLDAANRLRYLEQLSFDTVSDSLNPVDAGNETSTRVHVLLHEGDKGAVYFLCARRDGHNPDGEVAHYGFYYPDTLTFQEVCTVVPRYDIVATLQLRVDTWKDNCFMDSAATIAHYVSCTNELKELHLQFRAFEQSAHVIIKGLSHNKTIEKLRIEQWSVNNEDIGILCRWVAASKTIYHLVYNCDHHESSQALAECAERFLSNSYGLTYMRIAGYQPFLAPWINITAFLRRNMALVDCAVHFVLGTNVKRAAAALERVSWHPQLACMIMKKTSLSMPEIKQKINRSLSQVRQNFWQISGVVKEELTCYERQDGQIQIDNLHEYAWLRIRSFLNVGDVLDSKVEKKRPCKWM